MTPRVGINAPSISEQPNKTTTTIADFASEERSEQFRDLLRLGNSSLIGAWSIEQFLFA